MRVAGRIISPIFLGHRSAHAHVGRRGRAAQPAAVLLSYYEPGFGDDAGRVLHLRVHAGDLAAALLEVLRRPVPKWLTWIGIVSAFCVAACTGFLLGS